MKKLKEILIWLFVLTYILVIFGFINKEHDMKVCKSLDVEIVDRTKNHFIEKEDVLTLLNDKRANLIGEQLININRTELENIINNHPTINKAEVYFNHKGVLNIEVTQRKPIVRVINDNEESYYIDENGFLMPLSDKFSAHVLIANGNISEPYHNYYTRNVLSKDDSINKSSLVLKQIYKLADFIASDKFWNAQIQQIYFNEKNEIELVPRVGTHIILFGNIENYERKFKKLGAVYEHGFKEYGWNNYRLINLKYENQVICTEK